MRRFVLIISIFLLPNYFWAQDLYDLFTIQEIKIYTAISNWDYQMDTAKASGYGTYLVTDSIKINGKLFLKGGIKYKGNSTYNATRVKNPFHIKLDHTIKSQDYNGYQDIKLGNGWSDPSMVREAIGYRIASQYMDVSRSNFAKVYINDAYWGIYSNQEDVGDDFAFNHFYSSKFEYFKCNPKFAGGPSTGSSLLYAYGNDSAQYYNLYERQSEFGWREFLQLMDTLNNFSSAIDKLIDLDRTLWMLAFNNTCVNLDSYSGQFRQNYYMYRDHNKQWIPIIWDLNMCFGSFTQSGGGNLNLSGMKSMSPSLHKTDAAWPLISKLMGNSTYERMYLAHMRTINNENFSPTSAPKTLAQTLQNIIDSAVKNDPNYLSTYGDFKKNLDTNSTGGTCGIFQLMFGRYAYLQSLYPSNIPAVSNIAVSHSAPIYGTKITITCKATQANSNGVFLGYRYKKSDKFIKALMYDDGNHNDGAANDSIFGASIDVLSLKMQYYIYAENNNAGIFSPERAEHEFYTLVSTITNANHTDVVLNEYLANNTNGIDNEKGKRKDWIEIVNKTNNPLGLSNLYLSDSAGMLNRWRFPSDAVILAKDHLLIWADDLDSTAIDLHTNFNLDDLGEKIILSDGINIADQQSFDAQTSNIGAARCPDAAGNFTATSSLTPAKMNDCLSSISGSLYKNFRIYPNPSNDYIIIESEVVNTKFDIRNIAGQSILSGIIDRPSFRIDLSSVMSGMYFIHLSNGLSTKIIVK